MTIARNTRLCPYAAWVGFATILNYDILNKFVLLSIFFSNSTKWKIMYMTDTNGILAGALVFLISATVISVGFIPSTANIVTAQTGSMATLQNIGATYAVSIIPGAAQRESAYHYFPPAIAVPTDTTVAWFNNDFGQPHTVTSGSLMLLISALYLTQV